MDDERMVVITYRNSKLEPVSTQAYTLEEYTGMLRNDLLKIITDIEDVLYTATDDKVKSEWPDQAWVPYAHIKHKLLDKAGEIGGLPDKMVKGDGTCLP